MGLTPAGQALIDRAFAGHFAVLDRALAGLSEAEAAQLTGLLTKLKEGF